MAVPHLTHFSVHSSSPRPVASGNGPRHNLRARNAYDARGALITFEISRSAARSEGCIDVE
jgi:hypothetical protein